MTLKEFGKLNEMLDRMEQELENNANTDTFEDSKARKIHWCKQVEKFLGTRSHG